MSFVQVLELREELARAMMERDLTERALTTVTAEREAEYEVRKHVLRALEGQGLPSVMPDKGHGVIQDAYNLHERCMLAERARAQLVQDSCENALVPVSLLDHVKQALHAIQPDHPALLDYAPSFGVWETLSRQRNAAQESARQHYEDCTIAIQRAEKAEQMLAEIAARDGCYGLYEDWVKWSRDVIAPLKHLESDNVADSPSAQCVIEKRLQELEKSERVIKALQEASQFVLGAMYRCFNNADDQNWRDTLRVAVAAATREVESSE